MEGSDKIYIINLAGLELIIPVNGAFINRNIDMTGLLVKYFSFEGFQNLDKREYKVIELIRPAQIGIKDKNTLYIIEKGLIKVALSTSEGSTLDSGEPDTSSDEWNHNKINEIVSFQSRFYGAEHTAEVIKNSLEEHSQDPRNQGRSKDAVLDEIITQIRNVELLLNKIDKGEAVTDEEIGHTADLIRMNYPELLSDVREYEERTRPEGVDHSQEDEATSGDGATPDAKGVLDAFDNVPGVDDEE